MPLDRTVPHLLVPVAGGRPAVAARSAGVTFADEEAALRVAARFGEPAHAVFAVDLLGRVAVGQASPAGFRFLLLPEPLFAALADPFAVAARFPPDWAARGELPALEWPPEPLPPRTVGDLQVILKAGDGPLLLGAAQALLDGGRVRLDDPATVPAVWALLPDRTRAELRPATFAPDDALGFHLSAGPPVATPGVLTADQCRDYPEGRYELALQLAVESGDQPALDRLLARRTSRDTLKLAATMVGLAVGGAIVLKLLG